jgi:hypothetical protein
MLPHSCLQYSFEHETTILVWECRKSIIRCDVAYIKTCNLKVVIPLVTNNHTSWTHGSNHNYIFGLKVMIFSYVYKWHLKVNIHLSIKITYVYWQVFTFANIYLEKFLEMLLQQCLSWYRNYLFYNFILLDIWFKVW